MTRLPIPGADNGSWGDILNDFLRVEHNDDGTLKTSYVDSSQKGQAGGIAELDGGGTVPASQLPAGAIAGDATAVQKGIMRLTGDLGGTADSPTVPGLAGKADASTVLVKTNNFSDLNNFTTARQNLGVAIGSDVQAWDAELDTWSTKTAPAGTVVGTTDAQTLTNKTLTSPVINTPTGITKSDVGLGNVDNTSDLNKPISTATQGALDLKANSSDLTGKVNKSGDTMTGQLAIGTNSTPLAIGDNTNSTVAASFQNGRAYVGYDAVGHVALQGGTSKGIRLNVNSATFGTGTVAAFDTSGQFTLSTAGLSAASGTQTAMTISPVINQSGTAAYTMLSINPSLTATGSGANYLIDAQAASSPRFQVSANVGAINQALVTAPNGGGDVAMSVQNNATTANETASVNFYTTTNLSTPFGRIRVSRVDGANGRMLIGPATASTITNHIQMYGDTGYMSLGAGSAPANGLVTIGSNTTAATGGLWFGTDVNLYRSAANTLRTDDSLYTVGSVTSASFLSAINRIYISNSGSNFPGLDAQAATDSGFVYHYFYRSRAAAPQVLTNDVLGAFGFRGHDGTSYINGDAARIQARAAENFTSGAYSADVEIVNNNVGTASSVTTWIFKAGGVLSSRVTGTAGGLSFGSGATQDVNLYRSAANVLMTDDAFTAAGIITAQAGINANSQIVSNVATPLAATDAVNKQYVDSAVTNIQSINSQTGTTYTLVIGDLGKLVTLDNASPITLTVPTNASVAFSVGTRIDIAQLGAGQVTIAPSGGVTISATPGLKLSAQYAGATLVKTGTDSWLLFGSLAA